MFNQLAITAAFDAPARAPLVLRGDWGESVRRAACWGYDALELHIKDSGTFPLGAVRDACARHGVRISAVATGQIFTRRNLCITSPDAENRGAAMAEVLAFIDLAAGLGATDGVIIGWVKGNRPEGPPEGFDGLLAGQLRRLSEYAAERGQRVLVEVVNRYETNVFNTAAELCGFLDEWGLSECRIHMDTFHMNIDEADFASAVRAAGSRLGYLHVADSNRLYPGAGHLDFGSIFGALAEVGYRGTVSLECIPEPDSTAAGVAALEFLSKRLKGS